VLLLATVLMGSQLSSMFLESGNFFYIGINVGEFAIMALPLMLIVVTER